jgi:hypothetical protein
VSAPAAWADRKRAELTAKLRGIGAELADWGELSAPGAELEKHHTQIQRLAAHIESMVPSIQQMIDDEDDILETWAATERVVLELHSVWDFFRNKFALRQASMFHGYLALADDFAWACYRPAQMVGVGPHNVELSEVREPPLVYLAGVTAPFAISRGASYAREVATSGHFSLLVRRLPVPVIGVPWFQLRHLPDTLVLGHEVGHLVEDDFCLTPRLTELLSEALLTAGALDRLDIWSDWLGEVFADIYGTLAGGPAFAQAFADFAAVSLSSVDAAEGYPPVDIRVRIVARALVETGFAEQAADLLARWRAHVPHVSDVDIELPMVVSALINGPFGQFGGRALSAVFSFTGLNDATESAAADLLSNMTPAVHDVRVLLAAAGRAFVTDPARYAELDANRRVMNHASVIRDRGPRSARLDVPETVIAEHDKARAAELLDIMRTRT